MPKLEGKRMIMFIAPKKVNNTYNNISKIKLKQRCLKLKQNLVLKTFQVNWYWKNQKKARV